MWSFASIFYTFTKWVFSRVLRYSTTRSVSPSVHLSVCLSVLPSVHHTLLFFGICVLWPYCSCPNDGVASNMAPAHPHATSVAVYPALLYMSFWNVTACLPLSNHMQHQHNLHHCSVSNNTCMYVCICIHAPTHPSNQQILPVLWKSKSNNKVGYTFKWQGQWCKNRSAMDMAGGQNYQGTDRHGEF